jgi:hypothetical protein
MSLEKLHTRQYKLHTRQYVGAELLRPPRAERIKCTGRHATRAITAMVAVGLAVWSGAGIARADTNREREACALMDDHGTAIHFGYSSYPSEYAFAVLSTEIAPLDAAHVIRAATIDVCPNHAADMPGDWQ